MAGSVSRKLSQAGRFDLGRYGGIGRAGNAPAGTLHDIGIQGASVTRGRSTV